MIISWINCRGKEQRVERSDEVLRLELKPMRRQTLRPRQNDSFASVIVGLVTTLSLGSVSSSSAFIHKKEAHAS